MAKQAKRTASKSAKTSKTATARKSARAAKAGRTTQAVAPATPTRTRQATRGVAAPHADPVALDAPFRPFLGWPHGHILDAAPTPRAVAPTAAAAAAMAAPMVAARALPTTGQIQLSVFDVTRRLFSAGG